MRAEEAEGKSGGRSWASKAGRNAVEGLRRSVPLPNVPAAQRAFYGLDLNGTTLPPLDWPSIGELNGARLAWENALPVKSTTTDAYDEGQQAASPQRPADDALLLDLWDTIEYNLRAAPPPTSAAAPRMGPHLRRRPHPATTRPAHASLP